MEPVRAVDSSTAPFPDDLVMLVKVLPPFIVREAPVTEMIGALPLRLEAVIAENVAVPLVRLKRGEE